MNGVLRAGQYSSSNTLFCRCGYRYSSGYPRSKGTVLLGFRLNGVIVGVSNNGTSDRVRSGYRFGGYKRDKKYSDLGFRLGCEGCNKGMWVCC